MKRVPACLLAILLAAACGDPNGGPTPVEWRAQIDTIGDTIVVRTIEGSEWGAADLVPELRIGVIEGAEHEMLGAVTGLAVDGAGHIYIYDSQVPALRKYGPGGEYLGTLGREGAGPGEYARSDGGMIGLPDGRLVLRDPANGRFTVYGPDGEYLESWPTAGGVFTSHPMLPGTGGSFYSTAYPAGRTRLVRHTSSGVPVDTLALPERDVESQTLTARSNGSSQTWGVPFAPEAVWAFHPDGFFLSAITDRYAVDLLQGESGVLRIERALEPVPLTRPERDAEELRVTRAMRRMDPSWRWNGPSMPGTKPLLRRIHAAADGRIWIQLHQPGVPVPEEQLQPEPDGGPPIPRFREPTVFDVFEADGRYLGRVAAPDELVSYPQPVFRGEHVWCVVRDELGVQYVVRFRIRRGGGTRP